MSWRGPNFIFLSTPLEVSTKIKNDPRNSTKDHQKVSLFVRVISCDFMDRLFWQPDSQFLGHHPFLTAIYFLAAI
jgi:hypothetical protein